MNLPNLWLAPEWSAPTIAIVFVAALVVAWSYFRSQRPIWIRIVCGTAKLAGIALLAICLLEPMRSDLHPSPGANLFIVMADSSQSLQVKDKGKKQSRADILKSVLESDADWQSGLRKEFEVRNYTFDRKIKSVTEFNTYQPDGTSSAILNSLLTVKDRYRGLPSAGILLFTDGNATDEFDPETDWSKFPPVYPVVVGGENVEADLNLARVTVSQSNFEAAPVNIGTEIVTKGYRGESVVAVLKDADGNELQRKSVKQVDDGQPFAIRFELQPEKPGISFYVVQIFSEKEEKKVADDRTREATLANNRRMIMVDRGRGPYRVLYISGRPNWEHKFLRRAVAEDDEVQLTSLMRLARREPKFTFRSRDSQRTNPLFKGFDNEDDEDAEQYNQPVILNIPPFGAAQDPNAPKVFPKTADALFAYHAIILDDLEAEYFTQEQMALINQFVDQRGGGLLMLGGQETFVNGLYDRTPIGELLPVYLSRPSDELARSYRMELARDGWLQPWVRVRSKESEETRRLQEMTTFRTVNNVGLIKPGAQVLINVKTESGQTMPALVSQRFGKGRTAAMMIGDLWRWQMKENEETKDDLGKSWRQTLRWLVSDVPNRVEARVKRLNDVNNSRDINITVRDESFQPLDNATVKITVATPEGNKVELVAEQSSVQTGDYSTQFIPRVPGGYVATVDVVTSDGVQLDQKYVGWTDQGATEEFQTLTPNRVLLSQIAEKTGGELLELGELDRFVSTLNRREIPITETRIDPWWHKWHIFWIALGLFVAEWGLRRWKGLA